MIHLRNILFPTDFSQCADTAYLFALSMAMTYGAELHILHVCDESEWQHIEPATATALKEEVTSYVHSRLLHYRQNVGDVPFPLKTHLVFGKRPSREIIRFVTEQDVDFVVIGSSGTGGLKRLIHGSTAQRILKGVRIPVMSVHESDRLEVDLNDPASYLKFKKILVPIDFSDCSMSALSLSLSLAQEYQATILLYHVLEDIFPIGFEGGMALPFPDLHQERKSAAETHLRSVLPEDSAHWCRIRTEVMAGVPSVEILEKVQEEDFDLIVMGSHGKDLTEELLLGSVTDKVVRNATCPVITMSCL